MTRANASVRLNETGAAQWLRVLLLPSLFMFALIQLLNEPRR
jgi:hypothetical protein